MKILTQKSDVWGECPVDMNEAILWIEKAGRTCYRSEDKIVEGSGAKFVSNIIKRRHLSVIEHSNLVLRSKDSFKYPKHAMEELRGRFASKFLYFVAEGDHVYIGGNFRAWMEELLLETIKALFHTTLIEGFDIVRNHNHIPLNLKVITAEFLTDRAVTHELVRHRPASYSQESQRYYAHRKHLEVILPDHYADIPQTKDSTQMHRYQGWGQCMEHIEKTYHQLLELGERAEQARSVLPNSTATKIVATASFPEWIHIQNMRTSAAAYPPIRKLINPIKQHFHEVSLT